MPEFEEPAADANQKINYTPSTDATNKPRTRRRSGGFKTEHAIPNTSIGEINAADALKAEKLSGGAKPEPKKKNSAPKVEKSKTKSPKAPKPSKPGQETTAADPQPSPETLAAISRVEARLAKRKEERDAKRGERDKNRPAGAERKRSKGSTGSSSGSSTSSTRKRSSGGTKKQSGGIVASILKIFGIGQDEPKKETSKSTLGRDPKSGPRGNKSRDGQRHRSNGGSRGQKSGSSGKNRRSQSGGGGKGSRRGGKGPRKSDSRSSKPVS
jgi:hypothetical protein